MIEWNQRKRQNKRNKQKNILKIKDDEISKLDV